MLLLWLWLGANTSTFGSNEKATGLFEETSFCYRCYLSLSQTSRNAMGEETIGLINKDDGPIPVVGVFERSSLCGESVAAKRYSLFCSSSLCRCPTLPNFGHLSML